MCVINLIMSCFYSNIKEVMFSNGVCTTQTTYALSFVAMLRESLDRRLQLSFSKVICSLLPVVGFD